MTRPHQHVDTLQRTGIRLVGIEQLEGRQLLASVVACVPKTYDQPICDAWNPMDSVLEFIIAGSTDVSSSAIAHVDPKATVTATPRVSSGDDSQSSIETTGSVGHTKLIDAVIADAAAPDNYRVWQANKRDFLFPESWASPALRPDKSAIFANLEDELIGQSEDGVYIVELPTCPQPRVVKEATGDCDQDEYELTVYCFSVMPAAQPPIQ